MRVAYLILITAVCNAAVSLAALLTGHRFHPGGVLVGDVSVIFLAVMYIMEKRRG